MFVLTTTTIVILVLAALLTALAVGFLLRKDTAAEDRRKAVNKIVAKLRAIGGPVKNALADALECYVVYDWSGVWDSLKKFVHFSENIDEAVRIYREDFKKTVEFYIRDAEMLPWLREQVAQASAAQAAITSNKVAEAKAVLAAQPPEGAKA